MSQSKQVKQFLAESRNRFVYHMRGREGINGDGTTVIEKVFRPKSDASRSKIHVGLGIDCSNFVRRYLLSQGVNMPYLPTRDVMPAKEKLASKGAEVYDAVEPANVRPGDIVHWKGHAGIISEWDAASGRGKAVQIGVKSQVSEVDLGGDAKPIFGEIFGFVRPNARLSTAAQQRHAAEKLAALNKASAASMRDFKKGVLDPYDSVVEISAEAFARLPQGERVKRQGLLGLFDELVDGFIDIVSETSAHMKEYGGVDPRLPDNASSSPISGGSRRPVSAPASGQTPARPSSAFQSTDHVAAAQKRHREMMDRMAKDRRDREARDLRDRMERQAKDLAAWRTRMQNDEDIRRRRAQQLRDAEDRRRREEEQRKKRQQELEAAQRRQRETEARQRVWMQSERDRSIDRERAAERQRDAERQRTAERQHAAERQRLDKERQDRERQDKERKDRERKVREDQKKDSGIRMTLG